MESTSGEVPNSMQCNLNKDKLKNVAKPSQQKKKDQHGTINSKVVDPVIKRSLKGISKFIFQAGTSLKQGGQVFKARPKNNMSSNVKQTGIKIKEGGLSLKPPNSSFGSFYLIRHFSDTNLSSFP